MKRPIIAIILLLFPIFTATAQQGCIHFKELKSVQLSSLGSTEAEVIFVSNRSDLVIGALSIDQVNALPEQHDGLYVYRVRLSLKTSNGDWHRDRTFNVGIKNTSIMERYKKKSIEGGRSIRVEAIVVEHPIAMIERTQPNALHINAAEACVVFQSLLVLDIKSSHSQLATVSTTTSPGGLNEYQVVVKLAQLREGAQLLVSAKDGSSNVLALDVSGLQKREKRTYEIVVQRLGEDIRPVSLKQQYVAIRVEPKSSIVTFDGELLPVTDGTTSKLVPFGTYDYRVECANYHVQTGKVTVDDPDNTVWLNVSLKPNYGWIDVMGSSAEGGSVYIDNQLVGTAPYKSKEIKSGQHNVKVLKPHFNAFDQMVEVKDGQRTLVTPTLSANYARVKFLVGKNAEIWINGEMYGRGVVEDTFSAGMYNVETYLDGCRPQSQMLSITQEMKDTIITLATPQLITGTLRITSTPIGAEILIDGKPSGTTPVRISKIEVGEHNVALLLEGYEDYMTHVIVEEGEDAQVNAVLNVTRQEESPIEESENIKMIKDEPSNPVVADKEREANPPHQEDAAPAVANKGKESTKKKAEREQKKASSAPKTKQSNLKKYEVTIMCNVPDADMYVDDHFVSRGDGVVPLLEGEHVLEAIAPNQKHFKGRFEVRGTMTYRVTMQEQLTYDVEITCNVENAKIYVDNRLVHISSDSIIPLSYGLHRIEVVADQHIPYEDMVDLESDTTLSFILKRGVSSEKNLIITIGDVPFKMVYVKGGTYRMGSVWSNDEQPIHKVELSNFYIGETEVTQALWRVVMADSPVKVAWSSSIGIGDDYPAYRITYKDALAFIERLNHLTGKKFRLPTEAEWEYAARGGTKGDDFKYSGSNNLNEVGWALGRLSPVRKKYCNDLGIYDMSGNVWEWCSDWYSMNYYNVSPMRNPQGPSMGTQRVRRGGCWDNKESACRITHRDYLQPSNPSNFVGLRLVMEADEVRTKN